MSTKELVRVRVLALVLEGQLALQDGAARLGVSPRHLRRLAARYAVQGEVGLLHGNRGRSPANRYAPELRQRVLQLAEGPYSGCNDHHLAELLAEREDLHLGRETLRRWLRQAGLQPKRRRRPRKHHRRRERSPARGLLVLWDGSPHRWLGPDQPELTLMAAVDDADGALLAAFFVLQESTEAYLRLLQHILRRRGIPLAIYQDRHSALRRSDEAWTLEEQLAGRRRPTQVGLALEELGIRSIFALSPQAKGRIERLFGVLQDRLLAELRLDQITTLQDANRYLEAYWIARYNRRFRKPPATKASAYRSTRDLDLHKILSFRYQATVLNDNTVRLGGLILDIPPGPRSRSYAKAQLDVRQHLDGSWSAYFQDSRIARAPASPLAEPLRYRRHRPPAARTKAATIETLLYLPDSQPQPKDVFPGPLGGPIAWA